MIGATPRQADRRTAHRDGGLPHASPLGPLQTRLRQLERQLERLERLSSTALEDLVLLEDDLAEAAAKHSEVLMPCVSRRRRSAPATASLVASVMRPAPGCVTMVVNGIERRVALSALHVGLVVLLAAPTRQSPDHLVGFKTLAQIVNAFRARKRQASPRSVTVAISRLRQAFGSYDGLVETARGGGYRIRVLASGPEIHLDR